jgi:hypothetical protein
MSGKGKYTCSDGDSYEGDFVNGVRHGKGLYKWANGDTFTGDFKDDLEHG